MVNSDNLIIRQDKRKAGDSPEQFAERDVGKAKDAKSTQTKGKVKEKKTKYILKLRISGNWKEKKEKTNSAKKEKKVAFLIKGFK